MHLILPANSCSNAFKARRLSPWIRQLSYILWSLLSFTAWYECSASSSKTRGSSRGRFSLPTHVSSSFCLFVMGHPEEVQPRLGPGPAEKPRRLHEQPHLVQRGDRARHQ